MEIFENEEDENYFYSYLKIILLFIFISSAIKIKNEEKQIPSKNEEIQNKIEEIKDNNEEFQNLEIKNTISIENRKEQELQDYKQFLNFKDRPKDRNDPLIKRERDLILRKYSENLGYEISGRINIFLDMKFNFGNQLSILNKLIFYCEIIECKKIILEKDNNLYIHNNIYDKDYDLSIEVSNIEHDSLNNFEFNIFEDMNNYKLSENKDYYMLTSLNYNFYYDTYILKIENRFDVFKNEILKNLPRVIINKNDIYMHIRGGDIFKNKNPDYAPDYAQPPLCFYEKIINENNFSNIFIISEDKENPIINRLIKKYKNVIYKSNNIDKDISSLAYAYNIVGSISSFLISIIKINNNLKYFWEYNRYPISLGIPHLHHLLYNFKRKYTIFKMEPSEKYKEKMIIWESNEKQLKLMMNDKCGNFTIVKPNI